MTGQQFSEVDFDLLADYVGGALDGAPEEAMVARRVAEEPAWAEAYSALAEATGSVRASLASWGESAEPMPTEVADRIATALEQEPHRPALSAVPSDPDGPRRTAARRRRRLPSWAGPAAIAAGIAALAGFGLSQAGDLDAGSDDSAAGSAAESPALAEDNSAPGAAVAGPYASVTVATSGTDYRATTLSAAGSPPGGRVLAFASGAQEKANQERMDIDAPPALQRLRDPRALAECIEAIGRDHRPGITGVEVVDLASFEGSPAAVVFFTDRSGARWIWVSGPDCGLARGADTRHSAKIR